MIQRLPAFVFVVYHYNAPSVYNTKVTETNVHEICKLKAKPIKRVCFLSGMGMNPLANSRALVICSAGFFFHIFTLQGTFVIHVVMLGTEKWSVLKATTHIKQYLKNVVR